MSAYKLSLRRTRIAILSLKDQWLIQAGRVANSAKRVATLCYLVASVKSSVSEQMAQAVVDG